MKYDNADIDEAIDRVANDVARRFDVPEFHGPAMAALLDELRHMEAARRSGDLDAAAVFAGSAHPALTTYRPTNATSRSKALLAEVLAEVLTHKAPPDV